jgi:starch phosphorylase
VFFPLADLNAQRIVDETYANKSLWTQKSILSTAGMGKFSTDRTYVSEACGACHRVSLPHRSRSHGSLLRCFVGMCSIREYARDIWSLEPARRPHPTEDDDATGVTRCV